MSDIVGNSSQPIPILSPLERENAYSEEGSALERLVEKIKTKQVKREKVVPSEQALKKEGVEGAAAVYLGDKIEGKKEDQKKQNKLFEALGGLFGGAAGAGGIGGVLRNLVKGSGTSGLIGKLLNPRMLMRIGGGAVFGTLLVQDFLRAGLEKFRDGDWIGGIVSTLFGGESVDENAVKDNMLRQAAKWGGFGTLIGGPIGALIGGALGFFAGGIKGMIEIDMNGMKGELDSIWQDESMNFVGKLWESTKIISTNFWQLTRGLITDKIAGADDALTGFREKLSEWWNAFKENKLVQFIGDLASNWWRNLIVTPFQGFVDGFKSWFGEFDLFARIKEIWGGEGSITSKIFETVGGIARTIWKTLFGLIGGIGGFLKGMVVGMFNYIKEWIVGRDRKDTEKELEKEKKPLLKQFVGLVGSALKGIGKFLKDMVLGIIGGMFNIDAEEVIVDIAGNVGEWFSTKVFGPVGTFFTDIWTGITGTLSRGWDGIQNVANFFVEKIWNPVTDFFAKVKSGFDNFWSGVGDAVEYIKTWINQKIWTPIVELFGKVKEAVSNFFSDTAIGQALSNVWDGIMNVFATIRLWMAEASALIQGRLPRAARAGTERLRTSGLTSSEISAIASQYREDAGLGSMAEALIAIGETGRNALSGETLEGIATRLGFTFTSIQDAIIQRNGQIIRTDPNDTLIASKNPVFHDEAAMGATLNRVGGTGQMTTGENAVVAALQTLIEVVRDKPFNNNYVQTSRENNFDSLRSALAYGE